MPLLLCCVEVTQVQCELALSDVKWGAAADPPEAAKAEIGCRAAILRFSGRDTAEL